MPCFTLRERVHKFDLHWVKIQHKRRIQMPRLCLFIPIDDELSQYEQLLKEINKGSHENFTQNMALMEIYESADEPEQDEIIEIAVIKVMLNKSYSCSAKNTLVYSFNINKTDKTFDLLWKNGLIKLTED